MRRPTHFLVPVIGLVLAVTATVSAAPSHPQPTSRAGADHVRSDPPTCC